MFRCGCGCGCKCGAVWSEVGDEGLREPAGVDFLRGALNGIACREREGESEGKGEGRREEGKGKGKGKGKGHFRGFHSYKERGEVGAPEIIHAG